jgi:hypothetical protein
MRINLKLPPPSLQNHPMAVRYQRRHLLQAFGIGVSVLFLVQVYTVENIPLPSVAGAILIGIAALYPSYLWCSGKALGMPVFPMFALTFLWTYALPLVSNHPRVITYSPDSHFSASIAVALCLGSGTFVWFQFVKSPPPYPKIYRALIEHKGDNFFLFILAGAIFFNMYSLGGWFALDRGIFTLIRSAILGSNTLAIFALSYRMGTEELSKNASRFFVILLFLCLTSSGVGLVLRASTGMFTVAIIAFILGRRKIPMATICIVFICLSLLHYGKGEMRAKYWFGNQQTFIQPWEYPARYTEWVGYSLNYLQQDKSETTKRQEKSSSLERSSVIQMLLLAQEKTPQEIPYLYGKTYSILPQILIPRFLNSNKIRSHEGTHILSIYYGLQTPKATLRTTIAWGLVAESYANFGFLGCAGIGIILGAAYGQATRWNIHTPLLSARSLFNVLLISCAFQTEWTAGVYVASLFQASIVLLIITVVFMKAYKLNESHHILFKENIDLRES